MHIAVVLGSVREEGYTARAADTAIAALAAATDVSVDCIAPASLPLAFPGQPEAEALSLDLIARISAADGVLLVTPEYHGSFSSILKALIDNMGYPSALAGKPVGLLGVASGQIGAVKALEHLRSVCSHVGAFVLPYPVSISEVETQFDASGQGVSKEVEEQIRRLADSLVAHVRRLDGGQS